MTCVQTNGPPLAIALAITLTVSLSSPLAARDGLLMPARLEHTEITVDQMPPVMRAAYLKGIRDELAAHGYDPGPEDAAFGDRLRIVIQRYQLDAGLRPDGIASKELLEHLLFALPKVYADGSRSRPQRMSTAASPGNVRVALAPPTQRTAREQVEEPVPSAAPRGRVVARPLPAMGPTARAALPAPVPGAAFRVSPGNGGFVSQTQRALRDRGYYHGPIDGRFSDALADAIRAFQKANRLPISGVIDGPLLAALS